MANSKFAGLRAVRQPQSVEAEQAEAPSPVMQEAQPVRSRGRPAGKRSNPDWKLYSHFLKRRTQHEATSILHTENKGRDLSDVLQELLQEWVERQKAG